MAIHHIGGAITDVDTEAKYYLGLEYECQNRTDPTYGMQVWIYVYNDEASTAFAAGNVIARDASTATADGVLAAASTPSSAVLGVAQHAIAAGSYGWILRKGVGEVLAGTGTIDANEPIFVDTTDAGTAMEATTVSEAQDTTSTVHGIAGPFGYATEDAAATALATCRIDCRG